MMRILVLLDRSGSMQQARADHEGGLNSFIQDQRDAPGEARLTCVQFDDVDPCDVVVKDTPVEDVPRITLTPRGGTPLLDAIGQSVALFAPTVADGDDVVMMIITDGQENQSREWTKTRVKTLLEEKQKAGWTVLYLGANVDAFAEAGAIGIRSGTTAFYAVTDAAIGSAYSHTSSNLRSARVMATEASALGLSAATRRMRVSTAMNYSTRQRAAMSGDEDDATNVPTTTTVGTTTNKE